MKKLLSYILLCTVLCTALVLSAFASETMQYGYYDYNNDGTVEISDALSALRNLLDNNDSDVTIMRVIRVMQGAVAGVKIAATVNSIDTTTETATVSTEYCEKFTVPLSLFGLDKTCSAEDYDGVPAVLTVHAPASKFFDTYNDDGEKIYLAQINTTFSGTPVNTVSECYSYSELNRDVTDGSHTGDDFTTAYLELIGNETVKLNKDVNSRYTKAWYPRIKKVNDNLYLMLWMYGEFGQHVYYATSADGVTWNKTAVLWNSGKNSITYEGGTLDGESDELHAMNPDACVLDDGSVLCVFAVRAPQGYRYYPDLCGLYAVRGSVNGSTLTWGSPVKIYTGQVWEPSVLQRSDGQIHVYFTQVAPDIVQYGYDEDHRSTESGLIISKDNGATWTPNIQAGNTNYYRANTVYREYVGDKLDSYSNTKRPHYSGQMPVGVQLANGKILLAVEVRDLDGTFRISYATSKAKGEWTDLGGSQSDGTYKEGSYTELTTRYYSSPYVDRFPSGEVFMTYSYSVNLLGRLVAPDAGSFGDTFECAPDSAGIWGSCSAVDSHKMAVVVQNKTSETDEDGNEVSYSGIDLYYYYLNHRINAKEISVVLDGFINEWENNSDALFVGSETQAQVTVQAAHDKDNVYFLITRLDKYLTSKDTATVYIAAGDTSYYTVTVDVNGKYTVTKNGATTSVYSGTSASVKRYGTVDVNTDTDTGMYVELAIPKSKIGLTSKTSFKALIELVNKDSTSTVTTDTLMNADKTSTEKWIEVVLED